MATKISKDSVSIENRSVNEIKMLLSNFADEDIESLQSSIEVIIRNTLSQISPDQRGVYVNLLVSEFPVFSDLCQQSCKDSDILTETRLSENDVDGLIDKLSQIYNSCDQSQQQDIINTLRAAGVAISEPDEDITLNSYNPDVNQSDDYIKCLMAEFIFSLNHFILTLLKNLDCNVDLTSVESFSHYLRELSLNSCRYKTEKEAIELNKIKHLITAILTSSNSIGSKIMTSILPRISPERIESDVKIEGTNFLTSNEVKCWKKYRQRYKEQLSYEWVENEIKRIISTEMNAISKTLYIK